MKRLTPREGYDLYAKDYRKDHAYLDTFMEGAESEAWARGLEALLETHSRVLAMDAGCGDGRTLGRWRRRLETRNLVERVELWGTDFSPRMIEAARGRIKGLQWDRLDLSDLGAVAAWRKEHGAVDLLSAYFLLVHFDSVAAFFAGCASLMAADGRLVMNTIRQPSAPELRAMGKPIVIEAWDYRPEEVIAGGQEAGFTLVARQDFEEKGEVVSTLLEWVLSTPDHG
jgi:SAM-dependent methyltransferase